MITQLTLLWPLRKMALVPTKKNWKSIKSFILTGFQLFFLGYKTLPFPILIIDAVALLVVILMNFRAVLNDVRNCEKSGSSIAVVQDALTLQNSEVTCPRSSVITSLALDWFSPKVPREKIKYAQVVDISSLPKLSTS